MPLWFGKKKRPETSPGGSVIQRYDYLSATPIGLTDESTAGFSGLREQVYGRFFGEAANVSHEVIPLIPHIDVYTYGSGQQGRNYCTLVTGGMSDLAMKVPAEATPKGVPRRVELIFYCSEPKQEYLETLRRLAHFPHDNNTWIGDFHTMPNGNPPDPFGGSPVLNTFLFLPTIVNPDAALPKELSLAGEPVQFLCVVPLTTPECNLKLAKGVVTILDLFEQNQHPHVFDPSRASYV